jgi:hypothetical protein
MDPTFYWHCQRACWSAVVERRRLLLTSARLQADSDAPIPARLIQPPSRASVE